MEIKVRVDMSITNDELITLVQELSDDQNSAAMAVGEVIVKAVISTALPFGIGSAITGLITEVGDRRWKVNVVELLKFFSERVLRLESQIVSGDFFGSAAFQALLFEAIDQERTNQYQSKRKMLAEGLAKSGTRQFVSDLSRETYLRVLRDLSPSDIHEFVELSKPVNAVDQIGLVLKAQTLERVVRAKSVSPTIYRLQGLGLVSMYQRTPPPNLSGLRNIQNEGQLRDVITKALSVEPQAVYEISGFGKRFLKFVTEDDVTP